MNKQDSTSGEFGCAIVILIFFFILFSLPKIFGSLPWESDETFEFDPMIKVWIGGQSVEINCETTTHPMEQETCDEIFWAQMMRREQ